MSGKSLLEIPYQQLADSPTVRYYTEWRLFDPYIENPEQPTQLAWSEELLARLGLKPDTILRPRGGPAEPGPAHARSMRVLAFHAQNLNAYTSLLVRDSELTLLVPKPSRGVLSGHVSIRAQGEATVNVVLLAPEDAGGLDTLTLDVRVEEGSRLSLNYLLFDSRASPTAVFQEASLAEGSSMETLVAAGRGRMLHVELRQTLEGEKASASTAALLAANRGTRVTLVTDAETLAPGTSIEVRGLGFAADGFIVHKGYAKARRGARESRLSVHSRLVPLSDSARVYAAPVLEIESDEPSEATHSVAQSPLDDDQLFYLQSRGFSEEDAVEALVRGAYNSLAEGTRSRQLARRVVDILVQELK